jgi:hypothetical protein
LVDVDAGVRDSREYDDNQWFDPRREPDASFSQKQEEGPHTVPPLPAADSPAAQRTDDALLEQIATAPANRSSCCRSPALRIWFLTPS